MQARRTAEEEGDYMAFEQLVAEAAMKKDKESKKKGKDKKSHAQAAAATTATGVAADAPNVPREKKT
jgi:hypothetical protein